MAAALGFPTSATGKTCGPITGTPAADGKEQTIPGKINAFIIQKGIPQLDWKPSFQNPNGGYIDSIKPSDMTHNIMHGRTAEQRQFLAVKTVALKCGAKDKPEGKESQVGVETFFQHGADPEWTSGGKGGHGVHLVTVRLTSENYARFEDLINGRDVVLNRPHLGGKVILRLAS